MRQGFFKLVMSLALFYLPLQALCWGAIGHRIVGHIADSYLTARARVEIRKILGNESVAMASTWGDFIKSDSTYKFMDVWHYTNLGKNLTYEQFRQGLKADTSVKDVYSAITFLTKELKKKSLTMEKKKMYLRLLIHFVGDVHQPLHVSPDGSTGGNDIKVQWFAQASNLHRVWDVHLIEFQQLSYTEYAAHLNHSTLEQRRKLQADPLSRWMYESYSIAQNLHNEITETNPRLSYRYDFDHIDLLNRQLLKGGIRLAGLLNSIFAG